MIHIGPHKTGTSTIQSLIRQNAVHLYHQGILPIARVLPQVAGQDAALGNEEHLVRPLRRLATRPSKAPGRQLRRIFKAYAKTSRRLLLSDEALLGARLGATREFYPRAEVMMATLLSVLPKRPRLVILYARHQDRLLESNYLHSVKLGSGQTFAQFLAGIDLDALSWNDLADRVAGVVGAENLVVLPFEDISEGVVAFAHRFFSLFTNTDDLKLTEISANPGLSAPGVSVARFLGPRMPLRVWQRVYPVVQFAMSHRLLPAARLFDERERASLRDKYAHDYSSVLERFGPRRG